MPPDNFVKRYYQLPRQEIGYLRFILEGYDGLAFARTLDSHQGLVEIAWPGNQGKDAEHLMKELALEIGMTEVLPPEEIAPL